MGGERASTTRRREAGIICARCRNILPTPPPPTRERVCEKCSGRKYRVYMHFMFRDGWVCQFLDEDLKTLLPRKVLLSEAAKIVERAEKGGAAMMLEDRQALDFGIKQGRGSVWLSLTYEQYQKLKRPIAR